MTEPALDALRSAGHDNPVDLRQDFALPVTYTLLVDASQSMHARMEFVRASAARLAASSGSPGPRHRDPTGAAGRRGGASR